MVHIRWMSCLRVTYVLLAFCAALFFGALKGLLVGPIAALLLIIGNTSIILGLFPAHLAWTGYSIVKTPFCAFGLKIIMLVALPLVGFMWLAIGIGGSLLIGVGYGFFTPWIATFEAFRLETEPRRFIHFIVDGTWSTIKGSCTVVRDFLDMSYHSYNSYLKELREKESRTCDMRLMEVPACIVVGLMGIIVDVPLFTVVAISKSPYLLLRGWQRLLSDLISREGPFFETACVPIAGIVILLWPLLVIGSILLSIFSSFFVGLYGAVIVYQESSFLRGMAYTIAMVADFDEYTNDLLYLREGSCFPRPNYRKKKISKSLEPSTKFGHSSEVSVNSQFFRRANATAEHEIVPNLTASRSIRETIQEVKMVQVWEGIMKNCEMRGKELVDLNFITAADCEEWIRSSTNVKCTIIGVGLPSYSMFFGLLHSIRAGTVGLLMVDGTEVTYFNRPKDRIMDWFFHPIIVLKDQIEAAKIIDSELRFLEKLILMSGGNLERIEAWDNGAIAPDNAMRNGEIQAISRRLQGLVRNMSRYPTYRRRYQQVVKALLVYAREKECGTKTRKTGSTRGSRKEESSQHFTSIEITSIV
ncbi:hypothetical protein SUGI_0266650 [Cryptomeria japonica]|uniref:uncharacterized membrane protein At3g27390 n=1 Tax=Cryptomeria japonica TaxID=3369 RepID=UPI002408CA2F|nr:uncharacterized membrane protein At3g27390 [Cryptomeria japonica]GLJ16053.1 hypothetical protein SUGI_0266650 [Cryptomeria japonica]